MSGESVGLLRIAAAVAPTVLPGPLGEAAAAWLIAEAECHEAVPELSDSAGRVLSSIAEEISGEEVEVDFSVTVSTLDKAVVFAREVLALAEQPKTPEELVEAVAREICNVGRDHDLWASDEVGESTREDLRAEARAAIVTMQQPGGINPAVQDVRLPPDELAAVEARFKAARPWRQRANRWMENEQLYAEIARLTAGADDTPVQAGVRLTPGQWIAQWNDASAEHRWSWADAIIDAADEAAKARTCLIRDHDGDLAALRAQLAATALPTVTRAQVRAAATALDAWNTELPDDPRFVMHHVTGGVDREPNSALIDEVLYHLGIRVQDGEEASGG